MSSHWNLGGAAAALALFAGAGTAAAGFATVINCPPTVIGDNQSVAPNTQVNVFDGGQIGDSFRLGTTNPSSNTNLEFNISGGTVGTLFRANGAIPINISGGSFGRDFTVGSGATITMTGGSIGVSSDIRDSTMFMSGGTLGGVFGVFSNSTLHFSGGTATADLSVVDSTMYMTGGIVGTSSDFRRSTFEMTAGHYGDNMGVFDFSVANIHGGTVGNGVMVNTSGTLNIYGGSVGDETATNNGTTVWSGSTINIHGGQIGADFDALPGSFVNLFGSEFALNGVPVSIAPGETLTITERSVTLTAVLSDGSLFDYVLRPDNPIGIDSCPVDATLTITRDIPGPGPAALLALAGFGLTSRRRR